MIAGRKSLAFTGEVWYAKQSQSITRGVRCVERGEISLHQLKVFNFVKSQDGWTTAKDIAAGAGVAERTARHHARVLVHLGVFDRAEVFPAHRYRLSDKVNKRNKSYMLRIEEARQAFGLP